jgi:hypothetical protein
MMLTPTARMTLWKGSGGRRPSSRRSTASAALALVNLPGFLHHAGKHGLHPGDPGRQERSNPSP